MKYPATNINDYMTIDLEHIRDMFKSINKRAPKFRISHPTCCPDDQFYQYAAERGEEDAFKKWGKWNLIPVSFDVSFHECANGDVIVQMRGEFEECDEDLSFINKAHAFGARLFAVPTEYGYSRLVLMSLGTFSGLVEDLFELGWYASEGFMCAGIESSSGTMVQYMSHLENLWKFEMKRREDMARLRK